MNETAGPNVSRWHKIQKQLRNDWMLYALLLPVLIWYIVFCYLPMGGVTLAFREYRYDMGLWHSPWVAFEHFETMFKDAEFWRAFVNTLIFSLGKLVFHFPGFYFPAFHLLGCSFRHFDQYVCIQRHHQSGARAAGIRSRRPADVADRISALYLDLKHLERIRLGRHHLYGRAHQYRPAAVRSGKH